MENLKNKIQNILNLYVLRNFSKAELLGKKLIKLHPEAVFLYNILGLILIEQKKIDEAIKFYENGAKIKPDYAEVYNNLGTAYKLKKNYIKAENYYNKSINLNNKLAETHNNLANLYLEINEYQKAAVCFKKSISTNPRFFLAHYNLGVLYKNLGRLKEAKKFLSNAIKLNKYFCPAHRTLSQIIKYKKKDNHFLLLKNLYKNSKINNRQKCELAFALGKASDDINDYSHAIEYYKQGNDLYKNNLTFSIESEKKEFSNIKKIFTQDLFSKFGQSGSSDSMSIFILGMPRSGTTLVEQILSSHQGVFGGGELDFLPDLVKKYFNYNITDQFLKNITGINKDKFNEIGDEYLENLRVISNNSEKVTDKLPVNFKWIGLIKLILPNSKIIHCTRNPKDICLSIFKNYFISDELNYAYNLDDISAYYKLYEDLMVYWKKMLPKFIIDINYEEIINNPEQQTRTLIKKCNLSWDKNCLKFYNNKRPIKTASDIQSRRKIYKTSIDSWKNYKKYLKEFIEKLPN